MRIAMCHPVIPQYRIAVFNLLGATEGVDLTIYAGAPKKSFGEALTEYDDFRFVENGPRPVRWLPGQHLYQPAQLEVMDRDRYDLVILSWNTRYRSLVPALRKARRVGMPIVLWGHGYSKNPSWWRDEIRRRVGHRADAIVLYSRTIAERLIERDGFDRSRVFVAQNAIDQTVVDAARTHWLERPDELAAFQAEHGLDPRSTVVFLSRLLAENRTEFLLAGLAELRKRRPAARLVIVGDGPARGDLEDEARRLGLADHVTFTGAIFDDMKLAPWMLSSTLFCYPVNIGLSILHAFGYGLPVVTSDDIDGHNPEIEALEPDVNGLLYRDGDVTSLAETWERLMDDPAARDRMGEAAWRRVHEVYTVPNMVQGFLDAASIADGVARKATGSTMSGRLTD